MGEQTGGARPARTGGSAALLLGARSSLVGCGRKPLAQRPRLGRSRPRSSLTHQFSPQTNEEDVRKAPCCGRGAFVLSRQKTRGCFISVATKAKGLPRGEHQTAGEDQRRG